MSNRQLIRTIIGGRVQYYGQKKNIRIPPIYIPPIIVPKLIDNTIKKPKKIQLVRTICPRIRSQIQPKKQIIINKDQKEWTCSSGHTFKKSTYEIQKNIFFCDECSKQYIPCCGKCINKRICTWFVNKHDNTKVIDRPGCLLAKVKIKDSDSYYIFYKVNSIFDNQVESEKSKITRYLIKRRKLGKKIFEFTNETTKDEFAKLFEIEKIFTIWPIIDIRSPVISIFKTLFANYEFGIDGNKDGITTMNGNTLVGWKFISNIFDPKNNEFTEEISIIDPLIHKTLILEINVDNFDTYNIYRYIFQWCITKYWTNEKLRTPKDIETHIVKRTKVIVKKYHTYADNELDPENFN